MAMSAGSGNADEPMSEMNSTPLIDVMLVLLIMFIITLPKPTDAIKVDLPVDCEPNCPPEPPVDPIKNLLYIYPNSAITWNGVAVNQATLYANLQATTRMKPMPVLEFQPDANAPYDTVSKVLALTRGAGVEGIGFVGNEQYLGSF